MIENDITYKIIGCVYKVYNALGPGLLESVYEEALIYEMSKQGLKVDPQREVPIIYEGQQLGHNLRLDLIVDESIIIELKSVEELKKIYFKQLQTYLKLSGKKVGLLINFNTDDIRKSIHRVIM